VRRPQHGVMTKRRIMLVTSWAYFAQYWILIVINRLLSGRKKR
jgi:hypothetical protein